MLDRGLSPGKGRPALRRGILRRGFEKQGSKEFLNEEKQRVLGKNGWVKSHTWVVPGRLYGRKLFRYQAMQDNRQRRFSRCKRLR
jgi:hypothetical protein